MRTFPHTSGDHRRGEIHVPISNTLVKPAVADGSAAPMRCESRLLPGLWPGSSERKIRAFFVSLRNPPMRFTGEVEVEKSKFERMNHERSIFPKHENDGIRKMNRLVPSLGNAAFSKGFVTHSVDGSSGNSSRDARSGSLCCY